jgi:hypothetical protein
MGCGSHSKPTINYFTIHLLHFEPLTENIPELGSNECMSGKFSSLAIEKFKVVESLTLIQYLNSSTNNNIKSLFDIGRTIKSCLYFLYYNGQKEKKLMNYKELYKKIPYEEMTHKETGNLEKLYIIDTRSLEKYNWRTEDFLVHIKDDYEILNKILNVSKIETENIQNLNKILNMTKNQSENPHNHEVKDIEEQEEFKIQTEIEGFKLEVNKDLNEENFKTYMEQIEKENVEYFHIRKNHFNNINLFRDLLKSLSKCKNLKTFTFTDNYNTTGFDQGWKIISDFLKETSSLKILNLSLSFMYDKYLAFIFKDSLKGKKIENLDLSSNFITLAGSKKISEWLKTNKSLKYLNLQQNTMNEFKREGADFIISSLISHPCIISLDLSNMIITGFGEKLADLIKVSQTLRILRIINTRMNLDDYKFLSSALCQNNVLTDLNISENDCKSEQAIDLVASFIKSNKTLMHVFLDNIGIGERNCNNLLAAIQENETIESYSFNDNPRLLFKTLFPVLVSKKNLKKLNFCLVEFSSRNAKEDEESLKKFKIERPDIVFNY